MPRSQAAFDAWWVGLRVSDLDDIATVPQNVASIPNPSANPYVSWRFAQKFETDVSDFGVGTIGDSGSATPWQGMKLHSKSRARLANVQETWSLTLFQDSVATVAKNWDWYARTLIALS
jgi:hypothetical protein